jgi:cytochrome c553
VSSPFGLGSDRVVIQCDLRRGFTLGNPSSDLREFDNTRLIDPMHGQKEWISSDPKTGRADALAQRAGSTVKLWKVLGIVAGLIIPVNGIALAEDTSVPNDMEALIQPCTPCHGAAGKGTTDPYFPRLAGKPSGYLYNQLLAFRGGRRKYPPMNYLLQFMPDAYLRQISEHFAEQRPFLPPASENEVSDAVLARGEKIAKQGNLDSGVPACVSCHGSSLTGQEPAIPGLLGLRAAYLSAQLGAWRYGTRTAIAPDCMQIVAGHLTEGDVRAVAAWLASIPAPGDPAPAPVHGYALPFACGSQQGEGEAK